MSTKNENLNLRIIGDEKPRASDIPCSLKGVKLGMTSILLSSGIYLPVTVLHVLEARIVQLNNKTATVLVKGHRGKLNKPERGIVNKALEKNESSYPILNDVEVEKKDSIMKGCLQTIELYSSGVLKIGDFACMDPLNLGDMIDITARSKGRGFTGRMKRHNHSGGPASHGVSLNHRTGGSNGHFQNRSKTKPGCAMAGRDGHLKVTMQNLQVVGVERDNCLMLVHGSIPGPKGSVVDIRRASKI